MESLFWQTADLHLAHWLVCVICYATQEAKGLTKLGNGITSTYNSLMRDFDLHDIGLTSSATMQELN
jgi:hypothetical protein